MQRLLESPTDDAHVVVAIAEDVVARRKAMLSAFHFHLIQLLNVKLVIADGAPIVGGGIHRETRRQRTIRANNQ